MTSASASELDRAPDPAYPTTTPPDPVYPCQTLEALGPPLEGVATPGMWSRLERPLAASLDGLWSRLGLGQRWRPGRWVTLQLGRIALNAHGWERLSARLQDRAADPALVAPPAGGVVRIAEWWEIRRARRESRRLPAWLRQRGERADEELARHASRAPAELDAAELARGPLGDSVWTAVFQPWLAEILAEGRPGKASGRLDAAILLERRFAAELGERLVARGVLARTPDVAYLTVEERLRAVHEGPGEWAARAEARRRRIDHFVGIELPAHFWGRPRVELGETRYV